MLIDIVILPPSNVRKTLRGFNKQLRKQLKLKWIVDNKSLIPHISLFHIRVDKEKINEIISGVSKISETTKKFPIEFLQANGHYPYFGINTTKSSKLYSLHQQVIKELKDLRKGEMPFIHPPKTLLTKGYAKKYGATGIFARYNPHITLGSIRRDVDFPLVLDKVNIKKKLFKAFLADTIAVAKIDKYWQVIKILKEFKLK